MRRSVAACVMALGLLLIPTAAAQTPTQDSVTGQGSGGFGRQSFSFRIDAHSGPNGEAPAGTASFTAFLFDATFTGPVTCLAANGDAATLNFVVTNPSNPAESHVFTYTVIDSPAGDRFTNGIDQRAPTDCSALSAFPGPITSGDIVVVDGQPPTAKQQCKDGGWRAYGIFNNRHDCVSFVRHQARQECIFIRAAIGPPAFRAQYGSPVHKRHAMRRCIRERMND
jgi:hypothetical protein